MVRVVAVNCLCDASVFNMAADFFINTKNIFFFELMFFAFILFSPWTHTNSALRICVSVFSFVTTFLLFFSFTPQGRGLLLFRLLRH